MESKTRPAVVNIAFILMVLVAVGYLAEAAGLIAGAGEYPDRVKAALEESDVDLPAFSGLTAFASVMAYVAVVANVIGAIGLAVLAFSVRAGHFAGRIVAWCFAGFVLLCNFCGLGSGHPGIAGIGKVTAYSSNSSGRNTFEQTVAAGYPDWYQLLNLAVGLFAIVALIAVVILLALRPANDYFRRPPKPQQPAYPYPPAA